MTENAPERSAIVDLLATWGAIAEPGSRELIEVIASLRTGHSRGRLRQVLDLEGIDLPDELRREIEVAVEGRPAPNLEARAATALRAALAERRTEIEVDFARWARLLDRDETARALDRIWAASGAEDLGEMLDAERGLAAAQTLVDDTRQRIEDEIRSAIEGGGIAEGNPVVAGAAREALAAGDPVRLADARRVVAGLKARRDHDRDLEQLPVALERLSESCRDVRSLADAGESGRAEQAIRIATVEAAERCMRLAAASSSPVDAAAMVRAVGAWDDALGAVRAALPAPDGSDVASRRAVAEALVAELRTATRGEHAEKSAQLSRALTDAAGPGGIAFHDALARAVSWWAERRNESDSERSAADGVLRVSIERLQAELARSAALLPTGRVFGARRLIEEAGVAVAGDDPPDIRRLAERIDAEAGQLRRLAGLAEETRQSRRAAQRARLRNAIERYRGLAAGRKARRLAVLASRLEAAGDDGLDEIDAELKSVCAVVGNGIRLNAARLMRLADRRQARASTKPTDGELESAMGAVRAALGEDDLVAMARESETLRRRLPRFAGPVAYAGLAALAVVLLLAAWLAWRSMAGSTHEYRLSVRDVQADDAATLTLVRDGGVFEERPYREGESALFDLPRGRYEVFVNGKFTGSVIRVPDDAPEVNDIPLPR